MEATFKKVRVTVSTAAMFLAFTWFSGILLMIIAPITGITTAQRGSKDVTAFNFFPLPYKIH